MVSSSSISPALLDEAELTIRKARMSDIPALLQLINDYAARGIMLPRTEFELSENIRDFTVLYSGIRLVACGALHFYTPTSGEVRSLAVMPGIQHQGLGRRIVAALEAEAVENELHAIFAFTYVAEFFITQGFHEVERGELPLKVWKDCLRCPKFQCCDEVAVMKALRVHAVLQDSTEHGLDLVQLPRLRNRAETSHP
jgi:amino-acid N-acetyltransferase